MQIDAKIGRACRQFLKALFDLAEPEAIFVLRLGFGPEIGFDAQPPSQESAFMAFGTVNTRRQLLVHVDGETAGPPVITSSDPAVVEVREIDGVAWAYQLAQGSATITVRIPLPGTGSRELTAVGLLVVNDPADDATIAELEFGDEEATPA